MNLAAMEPELPRLLSSRAPSDYTARKPATSSELRARHPAPSVTSATAQQSDAEGVSTSTTCMTCGGPHGQLTGPWRELLSSGHAFAALILSTSFSEKYQGRHMQPGAGAELRLPGGGVWRPTLLYRAGHREAVAFTWLGDVEAKDRSIYVAFAPMRRKRQFLKIVSPGGCLVPDPLPGTRETIMMSPYIQRKLCKVWSHYGLLQQVSKAAEEYPQHRVIFAGISHGATLAQAAALQFQHHLAAAGNDGKRVHCITWNAFKWTNEPGSSMVEMAMGSRLLPIVMSRQQRWDSVAGFPADLAPLRSLVLLDADTGELQSRQTSEDFPGRSNPASPKDWKRAMELHFASAAIKAMRQATACAQPGFCSDIPASLTPHKEASEEKKPEACRVSGANKLDHVQSNSDAA
eukprot:TRINITY_DN47286_c0_g1_i1.p1 TRINITY_DN47286_c0_g1~~TRINITY_DN47286_c0_g1_i1.p1  ORF type:complete len:405 (-),score=66.07 TRINITY_DN47286_c0_g1_i1:291-1505(-)